MSVRLDHGKDELDEVHEINVTPFIDVMLVLLIIFMVAAPLATVDIAVDLPASTALPQPRPDRPLFLTVKRDLSLTIGDAAVLRDEIGPALDRAAEGDRDRRIFLRADREVSYGDLMDVMNLLRGAGFLKVALVGLEKIPVRSAALASGDATRWLFSGLVALALHASGVVLLTRWPPVHDGDGGTSAIVVDLAPFSAEAPVPSNQDIAPGHLQQQAPQAPETEKTDKKTEEKIDTPPPAPDPEVVLPQETPRTEALLRENVAPPAPTDTAPPPRRASAAQIASWHRRIALQIERHKGYPAAARAHRQTGIAQLGFVIDRAGRVVASRIVRSSGVVALDQETLATVRRAQPFPPPPPDMPGERFDFTVPIRFNIR